MILSELIIKLLELEEQGNGDLPVKISVTDDGMSWLINDVSLVDISFLNKEKYISIE